MQQIFMLFPEKDRHESNDLWVQHPKHKNCWKIVGRADDYVYLSHGEGMHASRMELEIERCELVQAALIGGYAKPKPVLLVELVAEARGKPLRDLRDTLQPYLDSVNAKCHESVQLSWDAVIFTKANKPLVRTIKGSVARGQSLKLYEAEIEATFER